MDVKQVGITLTIAVLFSVFVFTSIEAVYPSPSYGDYCDERQPSPVMKDSCGSVDQEKIQNCTEQGGEPRYEYNDSGCRVDMTCSMCRQAYERAQDRRDITGFIAAALLGIIAIIAVLALDLLPEITYGVILGGLATLFTATSMHFNALHRWVRPLILLAELALVIYLTYTVFRE